MLSNEYIEKLSKPIIARQEAINRYVIQTIADRIKEVGELVPSDVPKFIQMLKTGGDVRRINEELARIANLQVRDVKSIIKEAAESVYLDAKPFYDYRMKSFIPFEDNHELQTVVNSISDITGDTFKNLSNTQATGFLIRDLKNPKSLKWHNIKDAYSSVIDEAAQATQSGIVDFHSAMRRTIEQLTNSGVRRVSYSPDSGRRYSKRLDSAVKQNLADGVRAINQGVQDEIGKQIDSDGKEISVHAMPAPDHAPIQGLQFTNEQYDVLQSQNEFLEAESYSGKKIKVPHRCIGIWNCRHFAFSVILGVMQPNYSQKQLDKINKDNEKGVKIDGKHYTLYEATQKQRELETLVRSAKDGQIIGVKSGDMVLAEKYQTKADNYIREYKRFSKLAGLKSELDNLYVEGYKRITI